jgi:hypothetical protein
VTARIFLKLILGVLFILIVALAMVDFFASKVAEKTYVAALTRELEDKGRMLALVEPAGLAQAAVVAGGRLTRIGRDGTVTFDSEANPAHMENHGARPEVREALAGRSGSDSRLSNTMGVRFLYVAVPVQDGALRIAVPLKDIEIQVNAIRRQLLAAVALSFLPAMWWLLSSPAMSPPSWPRSSNMPDGWRAEIFAPAWRVPAKMSSAS